jgi:hypothetical protein
MNGCPWLVTAVIMAFVTVACGGRTISDAQRVEYDFEDAARPSTE